MARDMEIGDFVRCRLHWVWLLSAVLTAWVPRPAVAQNQSTPAANQPAPAGRPHALDPALRVAQESLRQIQTNVRDYTAILSKRARVDGELSGYSHAFVKIRNRRVENGQVTTPLSVYMKFLKPDSARGREAIWVEGRNNGKIAAHEAGFKNLIRVNLDPHGSIAMRGQRYAISEIGLQNLVQKVIDKGQRDRQWDECQVEHYPSATVNKRPCQMFEIVHPVPQPYFEFHRAQVFFDDELKILTRYASWSWPTEPGGPPVLEEEYTYSDVKVNVGLTELDFDPNNPDYAYW